MFHIIDRRKNPKGKSLGNRQRFMRRARAQIKRAVEDTVKKRTISDFETGDQISINPKSLSEPRFQHAARGGERDIVVPGNKEFIAGDKIARPPSGGGRGGKASPDGEGEDAFEFALSRDEFMDLFFEDLELPDLVQKSLAKENAFKTQRAGFSVEGAPANLNLVRTMRQSLARRIGLKRPKTADMAAWEAELAELEALDTRSRDQTARMEELEKQIKRAKARSKAIPFIDPIDTRYTQFTQVPAPNTQAVMFCLMDVSGSMSEQMKELAKRFFMLLHMFLRRRYDHVEIVFIRHTSHAQEVDEQTFFYSRETGGTIVSTALDEMRKILEVRYPRDQWNIYGAQASDGDNYSNDSQNCINLLDGEIMPLCQYYAYIEIVDEREAEIFASAHNTSVLWRSFEKVAQARSNFAMKRVFKRADIFPVFRELFSKHLEGER